MFHVDFVFLSVPRFRKALVCCPQSSTLFNRFSRYYTSLKAGLVLTQATYGFSLRTGKQLVRVGLVLTQATYSSSLKTRRQYYMSIFHNLATFKA